MTKDDLIDRQAALKKLAVYIHLIDKTMGKGLLTDDDCMEAAKSVLGEDELPAAQPDHTADISKKVSIPCAHENDLIFRQAALDAIMGQPPEPHYPSWYAAQIEKLPAVQPATNCSEIPNGSDDTISRRAALDMLDEQIELCNKALCSLYISPKDEYAIKVERASLEAYKEQLENMPSAQPEQNGKWIYNSPTTMKCDRCGFAIKDWDWHRFKYCPNCRADMRGGEKK